MDTTQIDAAKRGQIPSASALWAVGPRVAVIGIFVLLGLVVLHFAKTLVAPVVMAAMLSTTLGPLASLSARYRVPPVLFAATCVLVLVFAINVMVVVLGSMVADWAERAPEITAALKQKAQYFDRPFTTIREAQKHLSDLTGTSISRPFIELSTAAIAKPVLQFMSPAIGELVLFFGSLFFLLLSRNAQRQKLVLMFRSQEARLRALRIVNDLEESFARYVTVVSVVNAAVGAAAAFIAFAASLPNPLVLGVLAALLNYVPYVGPVMVTLMLLLVGLVALPDLTGAMIAPVAFALFAFVEGQFITPSIIGRHMTVGPLAVFLSLAFWTWLWGPLGTLLATPLLIAFVVIWDYFRTDDTVELPG